MKTVDKTKDEWIKEQKGGLLVITLLVSMLLMVLVGLFTFGVGCIFLNFLQAFGCGIVASVLAFFVSGRFVGRQMKRELEKQAQKLQFRRPVATERLNSNISDV